MGESAAGLGLYLLKFTDPDVDDELKQVADVFFDRTCDIPIYRVGYEHLWLIQNIGDRL